VYCGVTVRENAVSRKNEGGTSMKYVAAAIVGATALFFATVVVGAILGGVFRIAPCYGGAESRSALEQIAGGAFFGALAGFYVGLAAALVGAFAGPVVVGIMSHRRTAHGIPRK
jgi:hypothetical protein